jgi:hypothetical protein
MIRCIRTLLISLFFIGAGLVSSAQSTLSDLRGTVHDASGAVIAGATVSAVRTEDNQTRTGVTNRAGEYDFLQLQPGVYRLKANFPRFTADVVEAVSLGARQQLRYDFTLRITGSESVTVNASGAGDINTSSAAISASLTPQAVLNLPANFRGAGSTSPLDLIQTLPGVQPDSGSFPPQPSASPNPAINFSIQGGLPSQSETTVDGISAQNQTTNNVLGDAFPSAEDIAEIRVDGVNNNAEYGQPGEITTVTKGGTNLPHGSAYWYFQNSGFDAIPFGTDAANKPKKVANDFGGSFGGPLVIPHVYDGRNKTFFFVDYEGLRYATSRVVQYLVPTVQMKSGNFSQEVASLNNPFNGTAYPNRTLTPNSSSAALLGLFPDPNLHVGQSVASVLADPSQPYNYLSTKPNSIDSDQYDLRLDRNFGSRATALVRYTNKAIRQELPADLALPSGKAFARYSILAAAFNYFFTPNLSNEFRFGFTLEDDGSSNPFNGAAFTANAQFQGLPSFPFNGIPHLGFQDLTSGGERLNSTERSRLFQYVDNVTWQRGAHTVRLGGDIRHLNAFTPLDFSSSDNYGNFFFQQNGSYTGNEFADFLAGVPYLSQVDNIQTDNNGVALAYAFYGQDTWNATPRLTLTYGLRYELHPAFSSTNGEIGNFNPAVAGSGQLIYPDGGAAKLSVPELAGFNACQTAGVNNPYATNAPANGAPCTPVLSNAQAGLPGGLRTSPRLRFEPRFGFAFRPFNNEKTAIRGGAGYYNITTSGALFYALTGTLQADLNSYNNSLSATGPAFSFPNIGSASTLAGPPALGTGVFNSAVDIHWHDPYSLQTNLSLDQDLGKGFGLRASYISLATWHLVWQPELNMLHYSSTTIAQQQPRSAFPFPNFADIYNRATSATANYQSGQLELSRHFVHGLFLNSAYTFAKSLADNQGTYGADSGTSSFVAEQGGYDATYSYNQHVDYGNVVGTRRHRWISSGLYDLPVGRGRAMGAGLNRLADAVVGGWQLSGIFALQSGPALTAYMPSGNVDPSGTGSGTLYFRQQRPDRIAKGSYSGRNRNAWFNTAAFQCPGGHGLGNTSGFASLQGGNCVVGGFDSTNPSQPVAVAPIGRFGTESIGDLTGPGTVSLSTGLSKVFDLVDGVHLRAAGTFTNVLNHVNLADPVLDVTNPSFGDITQSRGSDFGGNRTGQVTLRLEF